MRMCMAVGTPGGVPSNGVACIDSHVPFGDLGRQSDSGQGLSNLRPLVLFVFGVTILPKAC